MRQPELTVHFTVPPRPVAPMPVAAANDPLPYPAAHRLAFSGSGREFFAIWCVDILLTFASCGIHAPWACLRRRQYFARKTWLAGAVFDFNGSAVQMLQTRLAMAAAPTGCARALLLTPALGTALAFPPATARPFARRAALRHRAAHAHYRGRPLQPAGSAGAELLLARRGRWTGSPASHPGVTLSSRLPPASYVRLLVVDMLVVDMLLTVPGCSLYRPFALVRRHRFLPDHLSVATSSSFEHAAARRDQPGARAAAGSRLPHTEEST